MKELRLNNLPNNSVRISWDPVSTKSAILKWMAFWQAASSLQTYHPWTEAASFHCTTPAASWAVSHLSLSNLLSTVPPHASSVSIFLVTWHVWQLQRDQFPILDPRLPGIILKAVFLASLVLNILLYWKSTLDFHFFLFAYSVSVLFS